MTKVESKEDELFGHLGETLVFTISMLPSEARAREEVAQEVDGVQFKAYSKEGFEELGGKAKTIFPDRVVGITKIESWEVLVKYNVELKKKRY